MLKYKHHSADVGRAVVGVTPINNQLFVLRDPSQQQIEENVTNFLLLQHFENQFTDYNVKCIKTRLVRDHASTKTTPF
jgi:hypothetical protein